MSKYYVYKTALPNQVIILTFVDLIVCESLMWEVYLVNITSVVLLRMLKTFYVDKRLSYYLENKKRMPKKNPKLFVRHLQYFD